MSILSPLSHWSPQAQNTSSSLQSTINKDYLYIHLKKTHTHPRGSETAHPSYLYPGGEGGESVVMSQGNGGSKDSGLLSVGKFRVDFCFHSAI